MAVVGKNTKLKDAIKNEDVLALLEKYIPDFDVKSMSANAIIQSARICKPEVRGSIPLCSTTKTAGQKQFLACFCVVKM